MYSDTNYLEIVRLENFKSFSFNPEPLSPTTILAISVDNGGKRVAYSHRHSAFGHSTPKFDLEEKVGRTEVGDVKVAAIATTLISDVSITYDSYGEYLFAAGKERFEVRVSVWDLPKRCLRRSFTLSAGEFRDFPVLFSFALQAIFCNSLFASKS